MSETSAVRPYLQRRGHMLLGPDASEYNNHTVAFWAHPHHGPVEWVSECALHEVCVRLGLRLLGGPVP